MRWLVTGATGQLGFHLVAQLGALGETVAGLSRAEFDITAAPTIAEVLDRTQPQVVINAAAYTAVDQAEVDEERATAVNGVAPGLLAGACEQRNVRLVHVSTDYVFDGSADRPYEVSDTTGPRTAYGRSKLRGEEAVLSSGGARAVVRTSWVWGGPGKNFVDTMRSLAERGVAPSVVADQIGSPTYVVDLAAGLIELGRSTAIDLLHFCNTGEASWYDLAVAVFDSVRPGSADTVTATTTAQYPTPAPRPAWSVLSTRSWVAAGLSEPPHWTDAISRWRDATHPPAPRSRA